MIVFEHVTKRYPGGTVAVDDLSLEVPDGKIMVLVGPSGCGKTTTLRMVNRLVEPTGGRVLLVSDGGTSGSPSPTWKATNSASPLAEQHRKARRLISSGWEHTPASGWCLLRGAFRRRDRRDHL